VIIVLGRPRVYRPEPDGGLAPGGLAAEIALALGRAGATVELVGSIGDDPEGDHVVVELGRAGVGHAALLRDPSTRTPAMGIGSAEVALPRLEAADVELGLRYLADWRVLVLPEDLDAAARGQALEAAEYHAAAVVMVASAGSIDPAALGDQVTLLERPPADAAAGSEDDLEAAADARAAAADEATFAAFIAAYAARLDGGEAPAAAFEAALRGSAWEPSPE
jgi:hypothetical protein